MTNLPCFLAITAAKLCSAILEVRLTSYHLEVNILGSHDVKNLFTLYRLANMAASYGKFSCPLDIGLNWNGNDVE